MNREQRRAKRKTNPACVKCGIHWKDRFDMWSACTVHRPPALIAEGHNFDGAPNMPTFLEEDDVTNFAVSTGGGFKAKVRIGVDFARTNDRYVVRNTALKENG